MTPTLRPYQTKTVNKIRHFLSKNILEQIVCLPTGGGKTVVFSYIAYNSIQKGNRTMILCDRKELISQAYDKIQKYGIYPTIIAPRFKQYKNNCYLASVDTLINREYPEIDILIIDEAHKQTFDKIIVKYKELNPKLIILGFTATPIRIGKQTSLEEYYKVIIEEATIEELLRDNYLVPARHFAAQAEFDNLAQKGNDFDESKMFKEFDKPKLYDGVIEQYNLFSKGKKAIVFNVNREHSIKMTAIFNEIGISSKHLDGNTPPAERKQILQDFADGKFFILNNCSVLTTGYDEPSIGAVIVNRATMSVSLWLQMCGRGSRLFDNKNEFIIIDMGGNVKRLGRWHEPREWSLQKKKKRDTEQPAPVKECPNCRALVAASARKCEYCSHIFEIKEKEIPKSAFIEVTDEVLKKGLKRVSPFLPEDQLRKIAAERGYSAGWVEVQKKLKNDLITRRKIGNGN